MHARIDHNEANQPTSVHTIDNKPYIFLDDEVGRTVATTIFISVGRRVASFQALCAHRRLSGETTRPKETDSQHQLSFLFEQPRTSRIESRGSPSRRFHGYLKSVKNVAYSNAIVRLIKIFPSRTRDGFVGRGYRDPRFANFRLESRQSVRVDATDSRVSEQRRGAESNSERRKEERKKRRTERPEGTRSCQKSTRLRGFGFEEENSVEWIDERTVERSLSLS